MESVVKEFVKRSPLHAAHEALHAKFGPFGGWELPLYYTSILQEHETVRTTVGVFDVSHLGHVEVSGRSVLTELQPIFTQNLTQLKISGAIYSPMLNEQGAILDEMIIYRLGSDASSGTEPDRFRIVVNASNGDKVLSWLRQHLSSSMTIHDFRERIGTLAVQGPHAVGVVEQCAGTSLKISRYTVCSALIHAVPVLCARTGYTGEDGFELFVKVQDLRKIWDLLLEKGRSRGIQPIGLGARDTLRLEAGLPLGGSDLDENTTPLEAGLEWTVSWGKGSFIGREALERQRREGVTRRLVGFELNAPGIPRPQYSLFSQGKHIGQVTSGTFLNGKGIGMGYVVPSSAAEGSALEVEIHGRRVGAVVVKLPFYRRKQ